MQKVALLGAILGLAITSSASAHARHHKHHVHDPLAYCQRVATANTPGAQTLTVINDNSVNAGWLLRNECAVVAQADGPLRKAWGTPPIRFGSGGWPIYLVHYGQETTLGLPAIPTGDAGYHSVRYPPCSWAQGCPPPVPYAVMGDPTVGGLMQLSHEVLEMLVNPYVNRYINGRLVEICDPVEYTTPQANDGAMLSDFVTPAYFGSGSGSVTSTPSTPR